MRAVTTPTIARQAVGRLRTAALAAALACTATGAIDTQSRGSILRVDQK
jgi:hypothetical protein